MAGRPTIPINLHDDERAELEAWTRQHKASQSLVLRARIILLCDEGLNNTQIASQLNIAIHTAGRWRRRFAQKRIDGLADAPRSGTPRTINDQQVHDIVSKTLETTPANTTHWSTRKMAQECGISRDSVRRIWQAFGLQPHRS
jgi:putative transposase